MKKKLKQSRKYSATVQSMIDTRDSIEASVYNQNGHATDKQQNAIDNITRKLQQMGIE